MKRLSSFQAQYLAVLTGGRAGRMRRRAGFRHPLYKIQWELRNRSCKRDASIRKGILQAELEINEWYSKTSHTRLAIGQIGITLPSLESLIYKKIGPSGLEIAMKDKKSRAR